MKNRLKKGMVLCAGLGTRLQPITDSSPKPLVPVLNVPNILHSLHLLKRAGVTDIILNLHHLPDHIENFLGDGRRWGVKLQYSREQNLLGTGGGVKKAEALFDGEPLLLANCDFITNVDLNAFIERHFERNALATMILFQDPERQKHYSKVGVDKAGHLCSLPSWQSKEPARDGIFTGIHILANQCLRLLKEEPCGINEILYPALMKGSPDRVYGEFMTGTYWLDTGELKALWATSMDLLDSLKNNGSELATFLAAFGGYEQKAPGIWMPRGARLPEVKVLAPAVLGTGCSFGKNAVVGPYTVLGDNAFVGEGVRVSRFVGLGAPRIIPRSSASETIEGAMQFQNSLLPLKKLAKA